MLSRTITPSLPTRASSMRRLRRRSTGAQRLYCATNGCTSFLTEDASGTTASCRICGYSRRLS
jgi:hypothetical protein